MAAITGHLEDDLAVDDVPEVCDVPPELGGDPDDVICYPDPASVQQQLLQFAWSRRVAEEYLAGLHYEVAEGTPDAPGLPAPLVLRFDHPIPKDLVPWWHLSKPMETVPIFGETAKMACPSFDLPSGFPTVGGSCPAAGMCQPIIPFEEREDMARVALDHNVILAPTGPQRSGDVGGLSILETICTQCYATKNNYRASQQHVQISARLLWTQALLQGGRQNEWIDVIVEALTRLEIRTQTATDPRTNEPVIPVRLHSSGDFYSERYLESWIAVANQYPQILFWAPTRTWAFVGWLERWRKLLPAVRHQNLIVRPSALHFGDVAPSQDVHPWYGDYPFNAAGTTSLDHKGLLRDRAPADIRGSNYGQFDGRYDWGCQAYAAESGLRAGTCDKAIAPDGTIGCRVCWVNANLRVNFAKH